MAGVSAVVAVVLLLGACATTPGGVPHVPTDVLHVPGTYVADLWAPSLEYPNGGPNASVLMCLDSASAVHLETGTGSWGAIGYIHLVWSSGESYTASDGGNPVELTTPVLQPGCGTLVFGVDCCHVDHYLAITATKV